MFAFPQPLEKGGDGRVYCTAEMRGADFAGMELRDWFAGQALANGWRQMFTDEGDGVSYEQIAVFCYEMADAMMTQRAKRL